MGMFFGNRKKEQSHYDLVCVGLEGGPPSMKPSLVLAGGSSPSVKSIS